MRRRGIFCLATIAALALAIPAQSITPAEPKKVTGSGVDGIKLGARYQRLFERELIGRIRGGCELGGPNTRSAPLKQPLRGSVEFTLKDPRRVRSILVRRGGIARGVGIGATIEEIRSAFPAATVDHSTDETFLLTLVRIPKSDGGKIMFGVSTESKKATVLGVPYIAFCE